MTTACSLSNVTMLCKTPLLEKGDSHPDLRNALDAWTASMHPKSSDTASKCALSCRYADAPDWYLPCSAPRGSPALLCCQDCNQPSIDCNAEADNFCWNHEMLYTWWVILHRWRKTNIWAPWNRSPLWLKTYWSTCPLGDVLFIVWSAEGVAVWWAPVRCGLRQTSVAGHSMNLDRGTDAKHMTIHISWLV